MVGSYEGVCLPVWMRVCVRVHVAQCLSWRTILLVDFFEVWIKVFHVVLGDEVAVTMPSQPRLILELFR